MSNQFKECEEIILGMFSVIAVILLSIAAIGALYIAGHVIAMIIRNAA